MGIRLVDHVNLATELLKLAREAKVQIATAESCTGGLVSAAITDVAGSSDVFDRGFVTYSNAAKTQMLGVSANTLAKHGAVSEEVALEMAMGAIAHSDAGLAVSITGVAGPGGTDAKPEGMVCFAVALRDGLHKSETVQFGAIGRAQVRSASVTHALNALLAALSS